MNSHAWRQHRTRPRKQRENGAPTFVIGVSGSESAGHPPGSPGEDSICQASPPGRRDFWRAYPALKRRAILIRPYTTKIRAP